MRNFLSFILLLILSLTASARPLQVMFWNLESSGHGEDKGDQKTADLDFLCRRITQDFAQADLVGFAEVEPEWAPALKLALEVASKTEWEIHLSPTGGHDRLAIAWRQDRFKCDQWDIIPQIGGPFTVGSKQLSFRPSVYARLQSLERPQNLTLVVNHLARSNRENGPLVRRQQAKLLREWLSQITEPVLCIGDFNFDYHIRNGDEQQAGYSVLTQDDLYHWVRYPDPLIPTEGQCRGGHPFSYYESILDFIFVANQARQWHADSQVLTRPDDFCPEELNSDHRPIRAVFRFAHP